MNERFGPTVGEKREAPTLGQAERLVYLETLLKLRSGTEDDIRYQLHQRTASTVLTTEQFHASVAVLLIHSCSPIAKWRADFDKFCITIWAEAISTDAYKAPNLIRPAFFCLVPR